MYNEIKAKNERIENIDIVKKTISHQIEEIKKYIEAIERDKDKIEAREENNSSADRRDKKRY